MLDSGEKTYTRGPPDLGSLDLPDAAPRGEIQEVERRRARVTPVDRWGEEEVVLVEVEEEVVELVVAGLPA